MKNPNIPIALSTLAIYFGGLLSLGQILGPLFWSGIFLMALGMGWLVNHRWGKKKPKIETHTAADQIPPKELNPEEVGGLKDVLSFYGTEVTSHAGLTIGSAVAFLTLLQVRFSQSFPISLRPLLLSLLFVVILGGVYAGLRIVLYGTLSGVVMHASVSGYRASPHSREEGWPPLTKATMYSEYHLKNNTLKYKRFSRTFLFVDWRKAVFASAILGLLIVSILGLLGV